MFYFFVDPACHAKGALRNSGLTDKETSQKYQNIIGNICAFFLSHVIFMYLEQVWLQRSRCYNFDTTKSTSLEALDLCQTRSVHLLFTSTMWKRYFSYTPFPKLFSVDYKFLENQAILRKLIIFDKVTWRKTLVSWMSNE